MQFGKVYDDLTDIDFSLPPDTAMTTATLSGQSAGGEFKV